MRGAAGCPYHRRRHKGRQRKTGGTGNPVQVHGVGGKKRRGQLAVDIELKILQEGELALAHHPLPAGVHRIRLDHPHKFTGQPARYPAVGRLPELGTESLPQQFAGPAGAAKFRHVFPGADKRRV